MKEILIFLLLLLCIENITTISCIGGRVVGGVCKCSSGYRNNGGRCVKQSTIPSVKCSGGTVSGNKCTCPSRKKLKNGVCVKV